MNANKEQLPAFISYITKDINASLDLLVNGSALSIGANQIVRFGNMPIIQVKRSDLDYPAKTKPNHGHWPTQFDDLDGTGHTSISWLSDHVVVLMDSGLRD